VSKQGKFGIVVAGGPAPGINSVIAAATIRAVLSGYEVVGIKDGFRWIREGITEHTVDLTIDTTSRIHFRGGSTLGISRHNPTESDETLATTLASLQALGIDKLITIGGEGTAYCAYRISEASQGKIRVAHVPKTIDNDIDLPGDLCTFGYQTARHVGAMVVHNLMVDAKTTSRWFVVVAMGRTAGHLALGIGKSAGATITLIPEEFSGQSTDLVVDTLAGSVIKRMSYGRRDGVAVLAEGIADFLNPDDMKKLGLGGSGSHIENLRLARLQIGHILKAGVERRLNELGVQTTVVAKHVGYELRCADPVPFDVEYTRDLGFGAAKFLTEGGSGAMLTVQDGSLTPMSLKNVVLNEEGVKRVRVVDINSDRYQIACNYMIRLRKEDFESPEATAVLASQTNLTSEQFRREFIHVVEENIPRPTMRIRDRAEP
jgi:ATP-dependent phosphofructokinase / diphosphate-dependent phosphofructokinase